MAKKRTNVIPIIEDARHPSKYRMLVGMVDVIFSDVAQPDQVWFILFWYFHCRLSGFQFRLSISFSQVCTFVYYFFLVLSM